MPSGTERESVPFAAVETTRAYQQIVLQIENAIADGTLQVGSHLPSERDMMRHFAVSRPTVREALRVLESTGVVRSKPGTPRGPEVLAPSADVLYRPMAQLVRTNQLGLSEFLPVRIAMDSLACSLAAGARSPEHLEQLAAALDVMRALAEDSGSPHRFGEADVAFHAAVAAASGNLLVEMFGSVTRGLMLGLIEEKLDRATDSRAVMRLSVEHDTDILQAIRDGDAELASYLARKYIFDYYQDRISPAELPTIRALVGADPRGGDR